MEHFILKRILCQLAPGIKRKTTNILIGGVTGQSLTLLREVTLPTRGNDQSLLPIRYYVSGDSLAILRF